MVALLGGGTSLIAHTAKAATRLASNASPEPFSNIALSLGEDVAVFAGLALIYHNPALALSIFALAIFSFVYFAPKILRAIKAKAWLAFKKLNSPAERDTPARLPLDLSPRLASIFAKQNVVGETIAWAAPCLSGRGRKIPPNLFGALVATKEEPGKLRFVARKNGRPFAQTIELAGSMVARQPKFLSENLIISPAAGKGPKYLFVFPRSRAAIVEQIVEELHERLGRREVEKEIVDPAVPAYEMK
jgi:hypothetical protein